MRSSAIEGIMRGLADMQVGRVVPHDEAMAEVDAAIEAIAGGYEALATDSEREESSLEWSEALIGDGSVVQRQT